jgi:hypothetical protein
MNQVIPENLTQILLKRLFIFLCFVIAGIIVLQYQQSSITFSYPSFKAGNAISEINKTSIVFPAIDLR